MVICQNPIAVVVLSYNGKLLHKDFFPLLVSQAKGLYDVVLIDNASTDDTLDYVQQNFPTVKTIKLEINKGFANGYYLGLKQVQAKYYVLLSADFEVTPNWITPLYNLMEQQPSLAACQPKIKYFKDKKMFEYAGAGGGFMDKWGYMFCRGRIFFTLEEDKNQYNDTIQTFWASGGCMFIRSDIYHRAGGLDKDLYAHMEEIDLCWRIQNMGYKIAYCGASTVYHIGGSVISYGSPQKIFYNYRNSLVLLTKNAPKRTLLWLLPLRLLLDGVAGIKALFAGNGKETFTILKAHLSYYTTLHLWLRKRWQNPKIEINTYATSPVIYRKSSIVQYFLKNKKTFTELEENNLVSII